LREKWRLDALLGIGGMAAVYAATHRNGKRGAVKMLHLELSTNEEARRRFLREGYVANAVGHPGAVSVLDDDVAEDGSVFLVMELLEGQSVESLAASRPESRLSCGEVLGITEQLLDTLEAAHAKGIIHRDLKPENLFMTNEGQVKVLDFGLARLADLRSSASHRMTTAGSAMGTPAFMPPEQALGNWDQVGARTDLWAVGATMYNLLTGRIVHEADNVNKLLLAAMTKPAPAIASVDPTVPPAVAAIVDRALAFDAEQRWPDAASMRDAVRGARAADAGRVSQTAAAGAPSGLGGTPRAVDAAQRAPSTSLIGGTTSELRRTIAKRGILAGAVVGALAVGGLVVVLVRGSQASGASAQAPVPSVVAVGASHDVPGAPSAAAVQVAPGATAEAPRVDVSPSTAPASPAATASATAGPAAGGRSKGSPDKAKPGAAPRPSATAKNPWDKW
jgi:serine/threonine-protein kinase